LFKELGDDFAIASISINLGADLRDAGEYDKAFPLMQESLRVFKERKAVTGTATALVNLAELEYCRGDNRQARVILDESIAFCRERGDRAHLAASLHNVAVVALLEGKCAEAAEPCLEALTLTAELGDKRRAALCLEAAAGIAANMGRAEAAAEVLGAVAALREAIGAQTSVPHREALALAVNAVSSQLPGDVLERAQATGRSMSFEQAISLGLQVLSAPVSRSDASHGRLTRREIEVLRLIAVGLTDAQVAEQLTLSRHTVNAHLRSIFSKLRVTSRSAAARYAFEQGLV
jgi:ATP/maltotriose-dependent transcriptional regulator MalT